MTYKSKYLTHRVLPNAGGTVAVLAKQVADVLKNLTVDDTNTGCEGRLVTHLVKS